MAVGDDLKRQYQTFDDNPVNRDLTTPVERSFVEGAIGMGWALIGQGFADQFGAEGAKQAAQQAGQGVIAALQNEWNQTQYENFQAIHGKRYQEGLKAAQEMYNASTTVMMDPAGPSGEEEPYYPNPETGEKIYLNNATAAYAHLSEANGAFYTKAHELSMAYNDASFQFGNNPFIQDAVKNNIDSWTKHTEQLTKGRDEAARTATTLSTWQQNYEADQREDKERAAFVITQIAGLNDEQREDLAEAAVAAGLTGFVVEDFDNMTPREVNTLHSILSARQSAEDRDLGTREKQAKIGADEAAAVASRSRSSLFKAQAANIEEPTSNILATAPDMAAMGQGIAAALDDAKHRLNPILANARQKANDKHFKSDEWSALMTSLDSQAISKAVAKVNKDGGVQLDEEINKMWVGMTGKSTSPSQLEAMRNYAIQKRRDPDEVDADQLTQLEGILAEATIDPNMYNVESLIALSNRSDKSGTNVRRLLDRELEAMDDSPEKTRVSKMTGKRRYRKLANMFAHNLTGWAPPLPKPKPKPPGDGTTPPGDGTTPPGLRLSLPDRKGVVIPEITGRNQAAQSRRRNQRRLLKAYDEARNRGETLTSLKAKLKELYDQRRPGGMTYSPGNQIKEVRDMIAGVELVERHRKK